MVRLAFLMEDFSISKANLTKNLQPIANNHEPKSVIVYSNIFYTFAFVNDIKKWNKAVRSFVVKTVSNV